MSKSQPLADFWIQNPDTADRETYEANKLQAAADWLQLLQLRAKELIPGQARLTARHTAYRNISHVILTWNLQESWCQKTSQDSTSPILQQGVV